MIYFLVPYSQEVIDQASQNGHINILNWVVSDEEFDPEDIIMQISENGHVKILNWEDRTELLYSEEASTKLPHVEILGQ